MSTKQTAEKRAATAGARAERLSKKLAKADDAAGQRALRKRVKRAQRARRRHLVEAAGGAKAAKGKKKEG